METEKVNLAAWRLEKTSESLYVAATGLAALLHSLDWEGPGREEFMAECSQILKRIRTQAEAGILLSQRMKREADEWLATDRLAGGSFEKMARTLTANLAVAGGGVAFTSAQVLGASTSASSSLFAQEYKNLRWMGKFEEEKRLQAEIDGCQGRLDRM